MKRVFQTRLGRGGDCLNASVASVLDKELNEVPYFNGYHDWQKALFNYIWKEGYKIDIVYEDPKLDIPYIVVVVNFWFYSVGRHAKVMQNGVVIHDPARRELYPIELRHDYYMIIEKRNENELVSPTLP